MIKSDVDVIIENTSAEQIIRLILKEMPSHQVSNIRSQIKPYWYDDQYGTWEHEDECYSDAFFKQKEIENDYIETEFHSIEYKMCLLCGEEVQTDPKVHNYSYSHLFKDCKIARQLMEDSESENDFRKNVVKHLKYK